MSQKSYLTPDYKQFVKFIIVQLIMDSPLWFIILNLRERSFRLCLVDMVCEFLQKINDFVAFVPFIKHRYNNIVESDLVFDTKVHISFFLAHLSDCINEFRPDRSIQEPNNQLRLIVLNQD